MQDSRRREIRIKADSFRVKCIISRYGIIDLGIQDFGEKGLSAMDIARILSEFNVSFDMALNRLESLNVIDSNQKLRLDNEKMEELKEKVIFDFWEKLDENRTVFRFCTCWSTTDEDVEYLKTVL